MHTRRRIIAAALALALAAPAATIHAQQGAPSSITIPIIQALPGIGTFTGQLAVNSFRVVNGQLNAVGTLSGQIRDLAGNLLGTVVTPLLVPITNPSGSCSILHLELGPLDLMLLGLNVHLDKVVLDITAQPGPGNLLGNLLCAIANLLNNGGPLGQLVAALNQLLGSL